MTTVEHDPVTGLLAIHHPTRVQLLDIRDLAIVGAALIRHAAAGHTLTPELVWATIAPTNTTTTRRLVQCLSFALSLARG